MNLLIFTKKERVINFNKCFPNIKKALFEYDNGNIDIHRYIWIYLKKPSKKISRIKIKKKVKKIKKLSYIV